MLLTPRPTQLSGAAFLADRPTALLADWPRVGKTGAAILAADYALKRRILVVTTASGRAVWRRAFKDWQRFQRKVQVILGTIGKLDVDTDVAIVSWAGITAPAIMLQLLNRRWNVVIADEAHNAKNFEAHRTVALYGLLAEGGEILETQRSLLSRTDAVWPLTGTPMPNSPFDLYPMLRALCVNRLQADEAKGWPNVVRRDAFQARYCVYKHRNVKGRIISTIIGGTNLDELAARIDGWYLQRTQKDVGITEPIQELMPLEVPAKVRAEVDALLEVDESVVLACADEGSTDALEMHLGPLRRFTGRIKARTLIDVLKDELDGGMDKVVLMCWHTETIGILMEGLTGFEPVQISGATTPKAREAAEVRFRTDPACRVAVCQIVAAGEAIDLSAAAELIFVELSFVPKDMRQASLRITNFGQDRLPRVRVAVLEGSLDEALTAILARKWGIIKGVIA